jgi:hypothetical protein
MEPVSEGSKEGEDILSMFRKVELYIHCIITFME